MVYLPDSDTTLDDFGLSAFKFEIAAGSEGIGPPPQPPHIHTELEMVLVERGSYAIELAGRNEHVGAGELAVYWAGLPHRRIAQNIDAIFYVAQIPIVHVLSWTDTAALIGHLLSGRFLRAQACLPDTYTFARWCEELASGNPQLCNIASMEMQARLRRIFQNTTGSWSNPLERTASATIARVDAAIRYVLHHFREHITVDDIAEAVGWHRTHLMQSFHQVCGLTLWDYVTRVRLSEAQRLLTTTDLPVLTVCHGAGFTSLSRMYKTFRRHYDVTPSMYRDKPQSLTPSYVRVLVENEQMW